MNRPYVYLLTHRTTGQFYYGARWGNLLPCTDDLGLVYQSSSKVVHEIGFEHFDYKVVGEFDTEDDAYDHENRLIESHWKNPLILNRHYTKAGKMRFKGHKDFTPEHRARLSAAMMGRRHTEEHKAKISATKTGVPRGPLTEAHKENLRKPKTNTANMSYPKSAESVAKSAAGRARNYLVTYPDGHEELVRNLSKFCEAHGLSSGTMSSVINGTRTHHKHFKCTKAPQ